MIVRFAPFLHGERIELESRLERIEKQRKKLTNGKFILHREDKLSNLKEYERAVRHELSCVIQAQENRYGKEILDQWYKGFRETQAKLK